MKTTKQKKNCGQINYIDEMNKCVLMIFKQHAAQLKASMNHVSTSKLKCHIHNSYANGINFQ